MAAIAVKRHLAVPADACGAQHQGGAFFQNNGHAFVSLKRTKVNVAGQQRQGLAALDSQATVQAELAANDFHQRGFGHHHPVVDDHILGLQDIGIVKVGRVAGSPHLQARASDQPAEAGVAQGLHFHRTLEGQPVAGIVRGGLEPNGLASLAGAQHDGVKAQTGGLLGADVNALAFTGGHVGHQRAQNQGHRRKGSLQSGGHHVNARAAHLCADLNILALQHQGAAEHLILLDLKGAHRRLHIQRAFACDAKHLDLVKVREVNTLTTLAHSSRQTVNVGFQGAALAAQTGGLQCQHACVEL